MSATARQKALMPSEIRAMKGGTPIVSLTAYTTPMAQMMDAHCDFVLSVTASPWCSTGSPRRFRRRWR